MKHPAAESFKAKLCDHDTVDNLFEWKAIYQKSLTELAGITKKKRSDAAARLKRARARALRLGFKTGEKKVLAETLEYLEKAKRLYENTIHECEKECLELAVKIAESILQTQARYDTESLAARVRSEINRLLSPQEVKVRLHPLQAKAMAGILDTSDDSFSIIPDQNMSPDDIRIEDKNGTIELKWRVQLEMFRSLLLRRLQEPSKPEVIHAISA